MSRPASATSQPGADATTGERRRWWLLGAMGATLAMILIDETVVGVALPSIQTDLDMSLVASHWAVNSYVLLLAAFIAVGGRLGDLFGMRRVYYGGLALFAAGSVGSALAPGSLVLIVARTIQGVGGAIILPTSVAMVSLAFPPARRGMALGIYVACGGVGMTLGPLVGGGLTQALSWRWIFGVNPAIIAVVAVIVAKTWREPRRAGPRPRSDHWGLTTLVVGLSAVIVGVMQGSSWGWTGPATLAALLVGAGSLGAFWTIELHRTSPLIDVRLFRSPTFSASNLTIFTGQFGMSATLVYFPIYLQQELDLSPVMAGLGVVPAAAVTIGSSVVAGRLSDRVGPRQPILFGLVGVIVGMLWLGLGTGTDSYWVLLPALLLWGSFTPFLFAVPQRAIMAAVPADMQGETGGISRTSQMVGGTVAIAIFSALLSGGAGFGSLFIVSAAVAAATLAAAWCLIDRDRATTPALAPGSRPPSR